MYDIIDTDDDNDTILTSTDNQGIDVDGDGTQNYLDLDSDADEVTDECEGTQDYDNDGLGNWIDDTDNQDTNADNLDPNGDRDCDGYLNWEDHNDENGPCCLPLLVEDPNVITNPPTYIVGGYNCWGPGALQPVDNNHCPISPFPAIPGFGGDDRNPFGGGGRTFRAPRAKPIDDNTHTAPRAKTKQSQARQLIPIHGGRVTVEFRIIAAEDTGSNRDTHHLRFRAYSLDGVKFQGIGTASVQGNVIQGNLYGTAPMQYNATVQVSEEGTYLNNGRGRISYTSAKLQEPLIINVEFTAGHFEIDKTK